MMGPGFGEAVGAGLVKAILIGAVAIGGTALGVGLLIGHFAR